ncbi:ABC transporter permease [Lacticaseibacillus brantae]|uniref:ABC-type Na+ efflux pump n=1 Tax=Lacticaseibacillus brantae DSM 23927 TaxID=1423727 RepID=A0A0R2AYN1_9LACO|nr:ABC transporter permease [Lacticaseibacillus brantae]KRM72440.1 ABC-type Na+ efflux pump [Lacticaseibacillus brantae DSM 23927]
MDKFWVVFSQVFKKNVRSGSWLFLVAAPIIFALIGGGLVYYISQTNASPRVAVVSQNPAVTNGLKAQKTGIDFVARDAQTAERQLTAEKVDGVLTVSATDLTARYTGRENAKSVSVDQLKQALTNVKTQQSVQQLKLTPAQVSALLAPAKLTTRTVTIQDGRQVAKQNSANAVNRTFAIVVVVLIIMVTMTYGSMLAQEIATEKGSRIMEILLSSVSATTQFFGKIAGIFALLLTQIAVYVVAFAIAWPFLSHWAVIRQLTAGIDWSFLWNAPGLVTLGFFVIGTLSYAVLAALTGSLVSNQEQVSQAVMPLSMLGMLGYFGALIAQASDSMLVQVGSYIPFINVSLMPVQLTMGHASTLQAVISLIWSTAFLGLFTWFTATVYKHNVLVYSGSGFLQSMRTSWQIWRSERSH